MSESEEKLPAGAEAAVEETAGTPLSDEELAGVAGGDGYPSGNGAWTPQHQEVADRLKNGWTKR